jgi:septum formation protein
VLACIIRIRAQRIQIRRAIREPLSSMSTPFVYLASQSPRREELLTQIGVGFKVFVRKPDGAADAIDESVLPDEAPVDYVQRVARAKAEAGRRGIRAHGLPPYPLLAADTTVFAGSTILGKPGSNAEAEQMLRTLSGRTHRVYTAVALAWQDRIELALSESTVTMRELADDEIARYVGTFEPMGKAGAYAVQGRAAIFISRIEGSYSGVMGLPLYETANLLRAAGITLP